jgi:hypothetical protein
MFSSFCFASGTDVCNFRRSVFTATSSSVFPDPFRSNCAVPDDYLAQIYQNSSVPFIFKVRPPGGSGFGILSDAEMLWRSDSVDDTHEARSAVFLSQVFDYIPPRSENSGGVVGVITHGEMIDAIYKAAGISEGYGPMNTEVVPLLLELSL